MTLLPPRFSPWHVKDTSLHVDTVTPPDAQSASTSVCGSLLLHITF
jgi:hypothetical protein